VARRVAALLLRRLTGGRGELDACPTCWRSSPARWSRRIVSAAFGPTSLRLGDVDRRRRARARVPHLDAGDASGVLVVAPVILTWATGPDGHPPARARRGRCVLGLLVRWPSCPAARRALHRLPGAAVGGAALRSARRRHGDPRRLLDHGLEHAQNDGPFVRESITDSLLATQLFIAISALTSLCSPR
jgi:hypothetical protein